jgi:DNA-directed RNA polymerase II subunit RPB1
MIIVNVMTRLGGNMPLNRHGLNKLDVGPLVKCTFEETVDIIFDAGFFAENNPVVAVSDNIMMGQAIHGGTGKISLRMEPKYEKEIANSRITEKKKKLRIIRTYYSEFAHNKPEEKHVRQEEEEHTAKRHKPASTPNQPSDSPTYCPSSPAYNPTSPTYCPTSPAYNPISPTYCPTSPICTSPKHVLDSPVYRQVSPTSYPTSASSRPTSPRSPKQHNNAQRLFTGSSRINHILTNDQDIERLPMYSNGSSARGNPTMSVTSLQHLEDKSQQQNLAFEPPAYSYRPSSPHLHSTYSSSYEPSSPVMTCEFKSRQRFTGRKTISETLETLVPTMLAQTTSSQDSDSSMLPSDALYDRESGEIHVDVFEQMVKSCLKKNTEN